jgi:uncharacterized protein YjbJ (UPF0337 family)
MQIGTIDITKLRGVADKFAGLAKETTGVLIGNDRLQEAGEAQQDKATETLKALRDEAKAQAKEAKADSLAKANPDSRGGGVIAEGKGKIKQVVGRGLGDSSMTREGEDDEERGAAQRSATKDRVAAKAHEGKVKVAEKAQDAADDAS